MPARCLAESRADPHRRSRMAHNRIDSDTPATQRVCRHRHARSNDCTHPHLRSLHPNGVRQLSELRATTIPSGLPHPETGRSPPRSPGRNGQLCSPTWDPPAPGNRTGRQRIRGQGAPQRSGDGRLLSQSPQTDCEQGKGRTGRSGRTGVEPALSKWRTFRLTSPAGPTPPPRVTAPPPAAR
jgi:hypothetical protein